MVTQSPDVSRRHLIGALALTGVRATAANSTITVSLIGCGDRGILVARLLMKNADARLVALCDIFEDRIEKARKAIPCEGAHVYKDYHGTDGALVIGASSWAAYNKDGEVERTVQDSGGSHEKRFLESMQSRQRPNADIELGRLSTTLCHLGNISHRLGRDVVFDAATETFGDDKAANAWLTKQYRSPYELPKV